MRILLTGHLGYVGTILAPMLGQRGHQVTGLDADIYRACNFGNIPTIQHEIIKDIRDIAESDLDGYDAVIHLAGLSNDPLGDIDPALTFAINHEAAVRLANIAKRSGLARFVAASSCSVYGAAGEAWMDELSPFNPVTPYAQSKMLLERDIGLLADEFFCPVFLRAATVYGLSPRLRFDLVINNLTAWAYSTGQVLLKSDGLAWRPVLHVQDMARAFVAAVEAPESQVHNKAFNVGSTRENYRVKELAQLVLSVVKDARLHQVDEPLHDPRSYRVNCDYISSVLPDALAQCEVLDGIHEMYEAFNILSPSAEEFEGVRYQRVAHLKHLLATGELDSTLRRVVN